MNARLKHVFFNLIRAPGVNAAVRGILKPLSPVLPPNTLSRIPVSGRIRVPLPYSKTLTLVSDGSDSIASAIFWQGLAGFEPETTGLYRRLLPYFRIVFDIGANTGLFALLAAVDDPQREVHAFEPVPMIYDYLLKNIDANRLENIHPVRAAVSDSDGEMPLYVPAANTLPLSASLRPGFRTAKETVNVPVVTIDSYVEKHRIARVDCLKIDTEGTELQVLQGARNVLNRDEPVIICEILLRRMADSLQAFFENTPYRFFQIVTEGVVARQTLVSDNTYQNRNYLFVTSQKVSTILNGIPVQERP